MLWTELQADDADVQTQTSKHEEAYCQVAVAALAFACAFHSTAVLT